MSGCLPLLGDGGMAAVAAPPTHGERGDDKQHRPYQDIEQGEAEELCPEVEAFVIEGSIGQEIANEGEGHAVHTQHDEPMVPAREADTVDQVIEHCGKSPCQEDTDGCRLEIEAAIIHLIVEVGIIEGADQLGVDVAAQHDEEQGQNGSADE